MAQAIEQLVQRILGALDDHPIREQALHLLERQALVGEGFIVGDRRQRQRPRAAEVGGGADSNQPQERR
jgi:hypothetical protein